jgi:hypothetical protein
MSTICVVTLRITLEIMTAMLAATGVNTLQLMHDG